MNKHYYEGVRRAIEKFIAYICSGKAGMLPSPLKGSRQKLNSLFQQIAYEFLSGDFHANTRCDMRWVTHKYFAWLEEQGFCDLIGVGAAHIQKFLLECSEACSPGSVQGYYTRFLDVSQTEISIKQRLKFKQHLISVIDPLSVQNQDLWYYIVTKALLNFFRSENHEHRYNHQKIPP